MGLTCAAKVLKYCLFGFNFVFVVAGFTCLGLGISLIISPSSIQAINNGTTVPGSAENVFMDSVSRTEAEVRKAGVVFAAAGGVIIIISFLGCCGAFKEWRPLLILYAVILVIIIALEIAIIVIGSGAKNQITTAIKDAYSDQALRAYGGGDDAPNLERAVWDLIMSKESCCGLHSDHIDRGFNNSMWADEIRRNCSAPASLYYYPPNCCADEASTVVMCPHFKHCPSTQIMAYGCFETIEMFIANKKDIIIGVGVTVGVIQVFGIVFSLCLCRAISNKVGGHSI